jgi:hypothetical protein
MVEKKPSTALWMASLPFTDGAKPKRCPSSQKTGKPLRVFGINRREQIIQTSLPGFRISHC